jgi:broad specificity phosphatase PhoE
MSQPSTCTVYLIRHGETEWNAIGRWQGHLDVPLSAAGRAQAARLARRLAGEGTRFDALYSSDLSRAWETAIVLGGALGLPPAAAPALREIDLGRWSGKTRAEIAAAYPDEWRLLQRDEDFPRGGGESFAVFRQRVLGWLNRAAENHPGGRICAVTHGGCIRAVLLHALGLTWADRDRIPPLGNGSISVVERAAGGWNAVRMNDLTDLNGSRTDREEWEPA